MGRVRGKKETNKGWKEEGNTVRKTRIRRWERK